MQQAQGICKIGVIVLRLKISSPKSPTSHIPIPLFYSFLLIGKEYSSASCEASSGKGKNCKKMNTDTDAKPMIINNNAINNAKLLSKMINNSMI